jgi:hypothetical protein
MDPAAGFFHLRKLSRMFDAETQILEPVHEEKSAGRDIRTGDSGLCPCLAWQFRNASVPVK